MNRSSFSSAVHGARLNCFKDNKLRWFGRHRTTDVVFLPTVDLPLRLERERERNDKVPTGTSDTKRIHGVRFCDYRCSSLSSTTEPSARFIDSPGGTGRYGDFRQAPEGCRGLSPVSKRQELSSLVQRAGLSKRASGAGRLPHGPLRALEPRCELSKPPLTLLSLP